MGVYQTGNTVRLGCTFKDFAGVVTDPAIIKIIIYDDRYVKRGEITEGIVRVETGRYIYDYVSTANETVYYEWYGEIDGTPQLKRESIKTVFV